MKTIYFVIFENRRRVEYPTYEAQLKAVELARKYWRFVDEWGCEHIDPFE